MYRLLEGVHIDHQDARVRKDAVGLYRTPETVGGDRETLSLTLWEGNAETDCIMASRHIVWP
jgi:hypothetical protein